MARGARAAGAKIVLAMAIAAGAGAAAFPAACNKAAPERRDDAAEGGAGGGGAGGAGASKPSDVTTRMLVSLHEAAECPSNTAKWRLWCTAADGWAKGTAADIPAGGHVLIGFTAGLTEEDPVDAALEQHTSLSALALRNEGGKVFAKITDIQPQNDGEKALIGATIGPVARVLRGTDAKAAIPKGIDSYVRTLPAAADHAATKGDQDWSFTGGSPTRLRKVGNFWVAVETPTDGPPGIFVSIFTDQFAAAK